MLRATFLSFLVVCSLSIAKKRDSTALSAFFGLQVNFETVMRYFMYLSAVMKCEKSAEEVST